MKVDKLQDLQAKNWLTGAPPLEGVLELLWLGQAGFVLRTSQCSVVVDPYLSDSLARKYQGKEFSHQRMIPPPVEPEDLAGADLDLLFSTHAHTDHLDPDTLQAVYAHQRAPLCIAPRSTVDKALERGVPAQRLVLLDRGEQISWEHVTVTAVAAAHEQLQRDEFGNYQFLGYVIEIGGYRIYHSGDGVPYEGLPEKLKQLNIDIALLPVNGRDAYRAERGVPGNFTAEEACRLVKQAGIGFWIPQHFGMFSFNTEHPDRIQEILKQEGFTEGKDWLLPEAGVIYRCTFEQVQKEKRGTV